MGKKLLPVGRVISGKYKGEFVYYDDDFLTISRLPEITKWNKNMANPKYINKNTVSYIEEQGSVEKSADLADVLTTGVMWGHTAAMAQAQTQKDSIHTVYIKYKDNTYSVLSVENLGMQSLQVIKALLLANKQVEKDKSPEMDNNVNHLKSIRQEAQEKPESSYNINVNPNNIEPTISRIEMFIEDGEWEKANRYCETALDYFPRDYRLYLYSLYSEYHADSVDKLLDSVDLNTLERDSRYKRIIKFTNESFLDDFTKKVEAKRSEDSFIVKKEEQTTHNQSSGAPAADQSIEDYIRTNFASSKIAAVRYYVEQTGVSLLEARTAVERIFGR